MMVRLCAVSLAVLVLFCGATNVGADDSLPADMVQRLKDSTVYVKTDIGPLSMSGSGFAIDVTDNTVLIATNHHVISKPKELKQGSYIPGLRGRDRIALMRLQQALAGAQPEVSIVFNAGNPNEQVLKAEILAEMGEPDLAILRVSGVNKAPVPLNYQQPATPFETMNLFILGFPFGDALATNKGNPTMTIGKGSISSIHKDASGKVVKLQIDGALNPGNSGGPVVDSKGNLVGIAVQTIQGSNIGLAIPPAELSGILKGTVGTPTVLTGASESGSAPTYELVVQVADPMKKLKSVSASYVDGAVAIDDSKKGQSQLENYPGSRRISLSVNGRTAKAALTLSTGENQKGREVTVQLECVRTDGTTVHLSPVVVKVLAPVKTTTTVSNDGNSTTYSQTTKNSNGGVSNRTVTISRGKNSGPSKMDEAAEADDDSDSAMKDGDEVASSKPDPKTKDKSKSNLKSKSSNDDDGDKDSKKAPAIAWTNKITKMKNIPDDEVTGLVDGLEFKLDKATLDNSGLKLEMKPHFRGVFSEANVNIILFLKPNEDVSGRKLVVNGRIRAGDPHINMQSMRKNDKIPKTQSFLEYCLVLEFGDYNAADRVQPGKLYICLPDRGKSFLAGTFEAAVE